MKIGLFDNYISKFNLDRYIEYMIENIEYCQDDVYISRLHVERNQGAKLKEIDFVSCGEVFWHLHWQLHNEVLVFWWWLEQ